MVERSAVAAHMSDKNPISPPVDIEAAFHRLLEADRDSREFASLWAAVDSYLEKELARAKKATGAVA
jgi:hypothetical protein